jgi:hypothetical protein
MRISLACSVLLLASSALIADEGVYPSQSASGGYVSFRFVVSADDYICPGLFYASLVVDDTLCRAEQFACYNNSVADSTMDCDGTMYIDCEAYFPWQPPYIWKYVAFVGRSRCWDDYDMAVLAVDEDPTGAIKIFWSNSVPGNYCYGICNQSTCP